MKKMVEKTSLLDLPDKEGLLQEEEGIFYCFQSTINSLGCIVDDDWTISKPCTFFKCSRNFTAHGSLDVANTLNDCSGLFVS